MSQVYGWVEIGELDDLNFRQLSGTIGFMDQLLLDIEKFLLVYGRSVNMNISEQKGVKELCNSGDGCWWASFF
jgi:hypothetical protein